MKRCTICGRIPFFCKCSKNEETPPPLKQELIEPFITLEKKGIRPVIGFAQTQYQGTGKIEKRFYAGFNRIVKDGQEPYTSLGGEFLSATDALKAIIEATK